MKGNIHEPLTEINMTPFVDIVLVILIIFLLTAKVMMPRTFAIALPKAAQSDKLESVPINHQHRSGGPSRGERGKTGP
jgi:biopolymer transport protein ExbD